MKEKNNAITLIALVITIIVMLILVGVSMNLAIGENGLIAKARESKTQYQIDMEKEKLVNYEIEYYEVTEKGIEEATKQKMAEIAVGTGISSDKLTVHYNLYHANQNKENNNKELQEEYILYRYDKTTPEERSILEGKGIKGLRGDMDLDGFLTKNDISTMIKYYNHEIEHKDILDIIGDISEGNIQDVGDLTTLIWIIKGEVSYEGDFYIN